MADALNSLTFRVALASDLAAMQSNEISAHINPWSELSLLESLTGEHLCWLVNWCEVCVGHLVVMPVIDQWELLNLVINPQFQRQGCGKAAMTFLLQQAKLANIVSIFLEVRRSNINAIALYQRFGFLQLGVRKNYYPLNQGREDALIMQCSDFLI